MVARKVDVLVVGGGIVGLATARAILESRPGSEIAVLEKESALAAHQSGRNSGVLHSGIYYRPGSEKAILVREGRREILDLCRDRDLPLRICGKLIVGRDDRDLEGLRNLQDLALLNGVPVERLGRREILEVEPGAKGSAALHVPEAAVVDYPAICQELAADITRAGGEVLTGTSLLGAASSRDSVALETTAGRISSRRVVACAGLQSDHVATMLTGRRPRTSIVPFRGDYFTVSSAKERLVRAMIYPVPDPSLPFLGVHLTRGVDGAVHAGPSAVPVLHREAYARAMIDPSELLGLAANPGVWRLAGRHWRSGVREMQRSWSRGRFARDVAELVSGIGPEDLLPHPAGIRAQAVSRNGRLLDDFEFEIHERVVVVLNAPSPAATASIAIGRRIAKLALAGG